MMNRIYVVIHIHIHEYIDICNQAPLPVRRVYMHACILTYTHRYTHTCILTYTHTHRYTHTCILTYTYTYNRPDSSYIYVQIHT
jgi:hypothetical protein